MQVAPQTHVSLFDCIELKLQQLEPQKNLGTDVWHLHEKVLEQGQRL